MTNQDKSQRYFQSGYDFYLQGKYLEACKAYEKAIETNPNYTDAYNNWGNALGALKKYEEAIEKYQKAIEIDPNYTGAYNNWGLALYNLKRYEEAIEKYQRTIEINSNQPDTYYNWGSALYKLKRYEEAIEKYQKAIEINPKYTDAYNNWGNVLYDLKRYEEAIEKYQKAIEIDPNYTYAYYNLGNALYDLKRYEEAIEKCEKAIQIDVDYVNAYHNIAYYFWKQGKYKVAKEKWKKVREVYERTKQKAKDDKNADHFLYFGNMLHFDFEELNEAEDIYKEGLALEPNHIGILINLVDLYLAKRDEDVDEKATFYWKAREAYKKAEGILKDQLKKEEDVSTLLQLGQLLLKMEEYTEAETYLLKALEKNKESSDIYTNLGVLYIRKERFKKGIQYFEDALRYDPDNFTIRSNLAEAYLKAKQIEKSEAEYKKILKVTPNHVESHIGLGEVYTTMGEGDAGDKDMYEEAIIHFNKAISLAESEEGSKKLKKKELAAVLYSRGYARAKFSEASKTTGDEGLLQEALEDFRNCLQNDPDYHKAKRAKEKIEKRFSRFSSQWITEKAGPWAISILSLWIFLASQIGFYIAGTKKDYIGYYALFTFGSLIFMVAGLYLPQILKLKVGGIELEKSPVKQITTSEPLKISK
ncbi:MAG: tetratricopeptide repeat protein [Nitrospirae bacterium]|nr:tetratricopeptide repeat protein [Nitrospirota bacterium]